MILSASRRTDIPNYYSDWFFNRIKEGYVLVRNPMNIHQVSKISLSPDVVDCIVFWTKNPLPMLKRLDQIKNYSYYFQFTLNSYGKDIEPNVPSKNDIIIPTFQKLSEIIGPDRIIWRYDPILISDNYSLEYHIKYFEEIAKRLKGYTRKCTISFIDLYRNATNNVKKLGLHSLNTTNMHEIASYLSKIAFSYNMEMETCSEIIELDDLNIAHARCIDDRLIEKISGCKLNVDKDKTQRSECGCVASIDIGAYNTCRNGCKYCYATYSQKSVEKNVSMHNPKSPLLFGNLHDCDIVKERKVKSCKDCQISFKL